MNIRKQRILVVDDEPPITRGIRLILEQTGTFQVREENLARHAIAAAREFLPDLILLDIMMPGVSGDQLAEAFQKDPRLHAIPIVFLTALVTERQVKQTGGRIGHERFLAKPVKPDELIDCIREELDRPTSHPTNTTKAPEDTTPHLAY
jgi:CheY-like chemotaxis protein